jgi:ribose/xylose/arabinose/galactoside ABC-type transport system permease subunit
MPDLTNESPRPRTPRAREGATPLSGASALLRAVRWPLAAFALLLLFNALFTPGFFTLDVRDGRLYGVLVDILNHGSKVAIVALGMTLVIATGGVDLSVGAVVAIAGAVAASLVVGNHAPWPLAMAAALGVGLLCGAWNGALVVWLRLQPIVATLILMVAGRGVAQLITGGVIVTFENPSLAFVGNGSFVGLPVPVAMLAALFAATALLTRRTPLGLFIESVGDNRTASRLAGVNDRAVRLTVYAFTGFCAGAAGIIECAYIKAADANNAGQLLELDAILAVVIGGTALTGGRFILAGSVVGALLMQALTKTLYMQDVSADIAPAPKALVVIIVCLMQSPALRRRLLTLVRRSPGAAA